MSKHEQYDKNGELTNDASLAWAVQDSYFWIKCVNHRLVNPKDFVAGSQITSWDKVTKECYDMYLHFLRAKKTNLLSEAQRLL